MIAPTPPAKPLLERPTLARLLDVLNGGGEETRVVGGAVRNWLIDRPIGDVDLATTAPPPEVTRRAEAAGLKPVPTGLAHGTITVVVAGTPFEVTTLREDVETHGRHATVRFGRDFAADAQRRDFTMNALSVDHHGVLHDPVGGLPDLKARRVRFIGDPRTRIREDYLRILRLFRFHAAYGKGPLDAEGLAAAIAEREGLGQLSRERVRAEFLKLLAARRAAETVEAMADAGFLGSVTGGVGEHGRLARAVADERRRGAPADPILRLGALSVAIIEDAARLRDRLRLSNAEYDRLSALAMLIPVLRSGDATLDRRAVRRVAIEHGLQPFADALAVLDGEPLPAIADDGRMTLAAMLEGREPVPAFPLTGADVIAAGVDKGPRVGRTLARAKALWLDADGPTERGTVAGLLTEAVRGMTSDSR